MHKYCSMSNSLDSNMIKKHRCLGLRARELDRNRQTIMNEKRREVLDTLLSTNFIGVRILLNLPSPKTRFFFNDLGQKMFNFLYFLRFYEVNSFWLIVWRIHQIIDNVTKDFTAFNRLTAEIKFPVVPRMWNSFGNGFQWLSSFDIHSWTSP